MSERIRGANGDRMRDSTRMRQYPSNARGKGFLPIGMKTPQSRRRDSSPTGAPRNKVPPYPSPADAGEGECFAHPHPSPAVPPSPSQAKGRAQQAGSKELAETCWNYLFIVNEMRPFFSSTSFTQTVTTSPTDKTSDG